VLLQLVGIDQARAMGPLHATIEEFAAEGFTRTSRPIADAVGRSRLRRIDQLPKISLGLTLDALARRLRCVECSGPLLSVKPWRQTDASGRSWVRKA
jgi:hypothetical protein